MTFQSIEYLIFFPIVFILYWTICSKSKMLQNGLIVLASILFYGWCDWQFIGLLFLTALSTFLSGLLLENLNNQKRKLLLVATIVLNVGILFFFKYFNFFLQSFIDIFSLLGVYVSTSTLHILLPIGISFYTFQILSYIIDLSKNDVKIQKSYFKLLLYVSFFPQLIAGPIVRYSTIEQEIDNRKTSLKDFIYGFKR